MAGTERGSGLGTIFSFFLGLMLTAFIGVGVYTFYPPPDAHEAELREISRQEMEVHQGARPGQLSEADEARLEELSQQREQAREEATAARKPWGRTTSIVLIAFATALMAASLARPDELPVISNGLLLGGVFTMLYGVGWIVATDTSVPRFLVIAAALAITLALGWLRFARRPGPAAAMEGGGSGEPAAPGLGDVERRLRALEQRLDDAASALGPRRP